MTASDIRESFLRYFERHGHRVVPSSSLVPIDDPTLLFTNAGMNQFKNAFLGVERRDFVRAASSQKCMRVSGKHNDLDSVGPSLRHHTFFEMLGNFSFGDYFKQDAIPFAWELLTREWKVPADRLYATIFSGEAGIPRDDEAYAAWRRFLPADRIGELGLADNFWSMGDTGPCGRCSEVHYFEGDDLPCPEPVCKGPGCGCDRFVEIWNNVFMEFDRKADGQLAPLPAPSIDTGMGLERIAAVLQDRVSNYESDLFSPLLDAIGDLSRARYGRDPSADTSMRVIADHVRATTFLIGDGVVPSNEWRGYVLRKIMRRAMRHGKRLGLADPFLHALAGLVIEQMAPAYPELRSGRDYIVQIVRGEEERFVAVLSTGLPKLEEALERAQAAGRVVPGEEVFRLYDSFGLPPDFIEDLAGERRLSIDRAGFEQAMEAQRGRARSRSAFEARKSEDFLFRSEEARAVLLALPDHFDGYADTRVAGASVVALFDKDRLQVPELTAGQQGYVVLDRTPFYAEAGGQVSDTGRIISDATAASADVEGMSRLGPAGPRLHRARIVSGTLRERDLTTAQVDDESRDATRRNHTATHLLHAALRQVLGSHVKQAGSLVAPDRLRFDLVHFAAPTAEELEAIERLVNAQIYRNVAVETEVRATQEAMAAGAMALFGEKYGDRVRVVSVPGFSLELCGGTHCRATGDIGFFTIVQEGGIAAGVRRIEALTGSGAVQRHQDQRRSFRRLLDALNAGEHQAADAILRLQSEVKRLARDLERKSVDVALQGGMDDAIDIGGVKMVARKASGIDKAALRALADSLKDRLKTGVVVLASITDGRVSIVVSVTPDLTPRVHAGNVVKAIAPIVGGGGGGRPDFAEAGGRHPERVDALLAESRAVVGRMLGGLKGV